MPLLMVDPAAVSGNFDHWVRLVDSLRPTRRVNFPVCGFFANTGVAGLSVVVLACRRVRGAAGLGLAFGSGFLLLGLGWMQAIFVEAMFGLVAVEALFFCLLGALIKIAARTRWWPVLAAACWTAVEFTYSRFPFNGFGWLALDNMLTTMVLVDLFTDGGLMDGFVDDFGGDGSGGDLSDSGGDAGGDAGNGFGGDAGDSGFGGFDGGGFDGGGFGD